MNVSSCGNKEAPTRSTTELPDSNEEKSTVRTKRVKEARDEAKKEIADYKSSKEDEYKKFEAEVRKDPIISRARYT